MSRRRWALVGALVAALAIGLAALPLGPEAQQRAARQRWAERGPAAYRLVATFGLGCVIDVDVRDAAVEAYHRWDSCMHPARSAEDLFRMVESSAPREVCALGCVCRISISVHAAYDATYGHPQVVTMRLLRTPSLGDERFWRFLMRNQRLPGCSRLSEVELARVISLTPR